MAGRVDVCLWDANLIPSLVNDLLEPGQETSAFGGREHTDTDGGYQGTGPVILHRRERGQAGLSGRKEAHNWSHY